MIYIHIGRHKSGTTRLQEFLVNNRVALADLGFIYPSFYLYEKAHHPVALYLAGADPEKWPLASSGQAHMHRLRANFDAYESNFILSSEAFQSVSGASLLQLVNEHPTRIICYLREQASYLLSAYSQSVVGSLYCNPLETFATQFIASIDYHAVAADLNKVFGEHGLTLRIYDRENLEQGDICYDFLRILGLERQASHFDFSQSIVTKSVFGDLLKMKIALNRAGFDVSKYQSRVVYQLRALAAEFPEFTAKPRLSEEFLMRFRENFQDQNRRLFALYDIGNGSQFNYEDFSAGAGERALDADTNSSDILNGEKILDVLGQRDGIVADLFKKAVGSLL